MIEALAIPNGWPLAVKVSIVPMVAQVAGDSSLVGRLAFGAGVGLAGMVTVFIGLTTVYIGMKTLRRLGEPGAVRRAPEPDRQVSEAPPAAGEITAEVAHAIALALYMDLRTPVETLEEELTIKRNYRLHSAWWHSRQNILVADNEIVFSRWGRR